MHAVKKYSETDIAAGVQFEAQATRLLAEREQVLTTLTPNPIQVDDRNGMKLEGWDDIDQSMARNKLQEGDATFFPGQNSSLDPSQLPPGYYARGMNIVNRGGILQCRPGYRCVFALPEGNLQLLVRFQPKAGSPVLVMAVDGLLYVSEYPYKTYTQLSGVALSPTARQLYAEQAEQAIERNADGSLSFISPRNILIIQDGALTKPVIFDGGSASHWIPFRSAVRHCGRGPTVGCPWHVPFCFRHQ
jgi:hypothetical protein